MFKFSISMVKTRSMRSNEPSTATNTESNVSSSPVQSQFNRSEFINPTHESSIPINHDRNLVVNQNWVPKLFGFSSRVFKMVLALFGKIGFCGLEKISSALGVFGGCYALYQIYLSNIEYPNGKMEIVVLSRSTF